MQRLLVALSATFALVAGSASSFADGKLDLPRTVASLGTYEGVAYNEYSGFFSGRTSTGDYRVPYRIRAPADPRLSNQTILIDVPHIVGGAMISDAFVTRPAVYGNHFMDGSVGYSSQTFAPGVLTNRMLDPNANGVFVHGGVILPGDTGLTDDEITVDFARALQTDPVARALVGTVHYRYLSGFSEGTLALVRITVSGRAEGVFDLIFPFVGAPDLRDAFRLGRYSGKIAAINSEWEWFWQDAHDTGEFANYRYWIEPGAPHADDALVGWTDFALQESPAQYSYQARARFQQAHDWVTKGIAPPASTHLVTSNLPSSCPPIFPSGSLYSGVYLARDANCNALLVDTDGNPAPRLPFVELGEAQYVTAFTATYCTPGTANCNWCPDGFPWAPCNSSFSPPRYFELVRPDGTPYGFSTFGDYLAEFNRRVDALLAGRYILAGDATFLKQHAALSQCLSSPCGAGSDLTFTGNYHDYYSQFSDPLTTPVAQPNRGAWVSSSFPPTRH
jgi:hypothetical protein